MKGRKKCVKQKLGDYMSFRRHDRISDHLVVSRTVDGKVFFRAIIDENVVGVAAVVNDNVIIGVAVC